MNLGFFSIDKRLFIFENIINAEIKNPDHPLKFDSTSLNYYCSLVTYLYKSNIP